MMSKNEKIVIGESFSKFTINSDLVKTGKNPVTFVDYKNDEFVGEFLVNNFSEKEILEEAIEKLNCFFEFNQVGKSFFNYLNNFYKRLIKLKSLNDDFNFKKAIQKEIEQKEKDRENFISSKEYQEWVNELKNRKTKKIKRVFTEKYTIFENGIEVEKTVNETFIVRNDFEKEILKRIFYGELIQIINESVEDYYTNLNLFFEKLKGQSLKKQNFDYKKKIREEGERRKNLNDKIEKEIDKSLYKHLFKQQEKLDKLRKSYNETLSPRERILIQKKIKELVVSPKQSSQVQDALGGYKIQINDKFRCDFSGFDVFHLLKEFRGERFNEEKSKSEEFFKNFDVENLDFNQLRDKLEFYKKRDEVKEHKILNYLYEKAIYTGIKENISKDNFYIILLEMASRPEDDSKEIELKIKLFKKGLKYLERHLKNDLPNNRKILAELYLILGFLTRTTNSEKALHWIDIACKFVNEEQKIVFSKVIARIILDFALKFEEENDYSNALSQLIFSNEYDNGFCGTDNPSYFVEKKNEILEKDFEHRVEEKIKAKTEERDRIMSNLSHSIKNLIATVIDPLENLQREETYNSKTIENALRGTSLVRELVNAMNLSYKGTFEDFLFDVRENTGNERMSLEQIILEALKYSVGNMFDGKYFTNFMRNYFPSRESFNSGKESWIKVSQTKNWEELSEFLKKYFFKLELDLKGAEELVIGNQKGSAMKFTILFQEMLLNAVKYSSFTPQEQREIKISLAQNTKGIIFEVQNPYKENVQTKSTGLGLEIIKNFSKLLRTEPKILKENGVYTSSFTFQNLWEN